MKQYDLIYFMGDSWTMAYGQYEDFQRELSITNRWSALVSQHFGLTEINEAIAGCGNQTIFQQVYKDIYKFVNSGVKPLVVISYTDPNRIELWHPQFSTLSVISSSDWWDIEFYKTYITKYFNPNANDLISMNYILSIKTLLERFDIDYVDNWAFTPILENKDFNIKTQLDQTLLNIAGDEGRFEMPNATPTHYGHANVYGNQKIANKIIEQITKLYGR